MGRLLDRARIDVLLDQRFGRHHALRRFGPQAFEQKDISIVGEASGDSPGAADAQGDRLRLVPCDERRQHLRGGRRLFRRLEEPLHRLLGVARDGDPLQPGVAPVDEHEDVPASDIGAGRRHQPRERVVVELLVDDDPHADAVRTHHRQQQLIAMGEPALAHLDLPRHGQECRRGARRLGHAGAGRRGRQRRRAHERNDGPRPPRARCRHRVTSGADSTLVEAPPLQDRVQGDGNECRKPDGEICHVVADFRKPSNEPYRHGLKYSSQR